MLAIPDPYDPQNLRLNPSLRLENAVLRWLYFDGERESFQQMPDTPALAFLREILAAQADKMPFSALADALAPQLDSDADALQAFLLELVDLGLLEWQRPDTGLAPNWCGSLYQYLGFLPLQSPLISEMAFLLQWLRTAARTMPHQAPALIREAQRDAHRQVADFLGKNGLEMPPIRPENLFLEDTTGDFNIHIQSEEVRGVAAALARCWGERAQGTAVGGLRAEVGEFAERALARDESWGFLDFAEAFLREKRPDNAAKRPIVPLRPPSIGAVVQFFTENGQRRAVVNALFAGGGKMMARWQHLLPEKLRADWTAWLADDAAVVQFPWQGWSNANFQPNIASHHLAIPDQRLAALGGGRSIALRDVGVRLTPQGPQLLDLETRSPIRFTDLGLESVEQKPPVMQILWCLGMPAVSLHHLLAQPVPERQVPGQWGIWRCQERIEYDQLVLMRRTWRSDAAAWKAAAQHWSDADFFRELQAVLDEVSMPDAFFMRVAKGREKPQAFFRRHPLSLRHLQKTLKKADTSLIFTELLPGFGDAVVFDAEGLPRAAEVVLELQGAAGWYTDKLINE